MGNSFFHGENLIAGAICVEECGKLFEMLERFFYLGNVRIGWKPMPRSGGANLLGEAL
jgi:hypothetical protein